LNNTTDFSFQKKKDYPWAFTPIIPLKLTQLQFTRHQAVVLSFDISLSQGQRSIEFRAYKTPVGSNIPLSFEYTTGSENIFGSDENSIKWRFT